MSRTGEIGRSKYFEEDKPGGGTTRTLISGPGEEVFGFGRPPSFTTGAGRSDVARSTSYRRDSFELREKAPAAFTLRLDSGVRRDIDEELSLVRGRLGSDREAGGWLFAHRQAGVRASEQDICRAVTAGTTGHSRTRLHLSHPIETWWKTGAPHWRLTGDWHSHTTPAWNASQRGRHAWLGGRSRSLLLPSLLRHPRHAR